MLRLAITLLLLFEPAFSFPTTPSADFGESSTFSPDSIRLSEEYVRVMKKMDDYCDQRYNETDDKIIDMYTHCFSNLLRADKDVVRTCRFLSFRSPDKLKAADCSKEFTPKSLEVRNCITDQMIRRDPNFQFHDGDDIDDTSTRLFLDCMDQIF